MSAHQGVAERVFGALLRAYPAEFRARYAREMMQLFHDRRSVDGAGGARFWAETIWDVARSAPALRLETRRTGMDQYHHTTEGMMRIMAILTVLVGAIQMANAALEGFAGRSQFGDGYSLVGVALGLIAATLLVGAGIALLRRRSDAASWARVAAVACLAMVLAIRFVQPWMSIFGTLLGVGFPIALLIYLHLTRSSGPTRSMTA